MEVDTLDQQIIHALRLDGRVPFATVAEVLGVSDQTVARRYRRMRGAGIVRVVAAANPFVLDRPAWLLRLQATPDAAAAIAGALARRPDTTWISLNSGGTEIVCGVHAPGDAELLLQKLPRTPRIVSVAAHLVLRVFAGGAVDTHSLPHVLTAEQIAVLLPPPPEGEPAGLQDTDAPLLAQLNRDGRTSLTDLSTATGWSESAVRRRLAVLRSSGTLYFDVEVDPVAVGHGVRVMLWLTVEPAHLHRAATDLAALPEIVYAAAITGATNLVATAVFTRTGDVYGFLTGPIGALPGLREVQTAPTIRTLKQVGQLEHRG